MPLDIQIIDDNPADIRLAKEAFWETGTYHQFHIVTDGNKAIAYLRREEQYFVAPRLW